MNPCLYSSLLGTPQVSPPLPKQRSVEGNLLESSYTQDYRSSPSAGEPATPGCFREAAEGQPPRHGPYQGAFLPLSLALLCYRTPILLLSCLPGPTTGGPVEGCDVGRWQPAWPFVLFWGREEGGMYSKRRLLGHIPWQTQGLRSKLGFKRATTSH